LIKIRAWQSLNGLEKWLGAKIKKSYKWIEPASLEAQGKLENACLMYQRNLKKNLQEMNKKQTPFTSIQLFNFKFQSDRV
jgi:hypothetical protein